MAEQTLVHLTCQGLQGRLAKVFKIAPPQVRVTNDIYAQLIAEGGGYRDDNTQMVYPITAIRPASITEETDTYRSSFMAKSRFARLHGSSSREDEAVTRFNVVPVKYTFEFGYMTDDPLAFLDFAQRWMFHSKSGKVNYALRYQGVRFDIRVELDPNFDVPEKEGTTESQQQGVATSQITVHSYASSGESEKIDRSLLSPKFVFGGLELLPPKKD